MKESSGTNVLRAKITQHLSSEEAVAELIDEDENIRPPGGLIRLHLSQSSAHTNGQCCGDYYRFSFASNTPMLGLPAPGKLVMVEKRDQTLGLWSINRIPEPKSSTHIMQPAKTGPRHHNQMPIHRPSLSHIAHNGFVSR